ncbi:MAG: hypothetical protein KA143_04745 [Saprospiraceae bacterium]|nr:hypothetical protein [Saprospiraceae bacterium]
MKKLFILSIVFISFTFSSCFRDECTSHRTFVRLDPIYKTVEALRAEVKVTIGRELKNPAKIYVYNDYLLINEVNEGIHIYDNANPANPKNITFINIPGNRDMAIKENVLYADNAIDLLAIDISDLTAPKVLKRLDGVFGRSFGWNSQFANNPILVGYNETTETQVLDCNDPNFNLGFFNRGGGIWFDANSLNAGQAQSAPSKTGGATAATGVGGSMSRFGIVDKYLYGIDQSDLHVIYIDDPKNPRQGKSISVSWNIETLFPYKDKLFIGAQTGMFIMENKNPESPYLLSSFTHARACDPVFVDGDIAYITLRQGTGCQNTTNELDVVDIKNITAPRLIKRYPMSNPAGLSILENTLYLCESSFGLKIFDTKDINTIDKNLLSHLTSFHAYDVIVLDKSQIIVTGEDGIRQLDATDPKNIKSISVIPVVKS